MNQDWIEKTNEQIQFLLNEPPSLENAKNLASLYIIQERLGSHHHVSPEQRINTLISALELALHDFSDSKRKSGSRDLESHTEHFEAVLESINKLLLFIYQGISSESEKTLMCSLVEHWHKKLT